MPAPMRSPCTHTIAPLMLDTPPPPTYCPSPAWSFVTSGCFFLYRLQVLALVLPVVGGCCGGGGAAKQLAGVCCFVVAVLDCEVVVVFVVFVIVIVPPRHMSDVVRAGGLFW